MLSSRSDGSGGGGGGLLGPTVSLRLSGSDLDLQRWCRRPFKCRELACERDAAEEALLPTRLSTRIHRVHVNTAHACIWMLSSGSGRRRNGPIRLEREGGGGGGGVAGSKRWKPVRVVVLKHTKKYVRCIMVTSSRLDLIKSPGLHQCEFTIWVNGWIKDPQNPIKDKKKRRRTEAFACYLFKKCQFNSIFLCHSWPQFSSDRNHFLHKIPIWEKSTEFPLQTLQISRVHFITTASDTKSDFAVWIWKRQNSCRKWQKTNHVSRLVFSTTEHQQKKLTYSGEHEPGDPWDELGQLNYF